MASSTVPGLSATTGTDRAGREAFWILRAAFTAAPILFGLDKFANVMTDWPKYLAPQLDDLVPGSAHQAMLAVGVIEVVAGLLVAWRPRIGAYVVALWLAGVIVDLQATRRPDRKSTRLNSSHPSISYARFCFK